MLKLDELVDAYAVFPCHSWEDFPVHLTGDDASSALACWTALWHPALINRLKKTPRWVRVDDCQDVTKPTLQLVPTVSADAFVLRNPTHLTPDSGAVLGPTSRREILQSQAGIFVGREESAAPFFALGYAYLQLQLMTRQIRYYNELDDAAFLESLLQAAYDALNSDDNRAQETLQGAFDLLLKEKHRFYPSTARLLDLTVISDEVSAARIIEQLRTPIGKSNWLLSGSCLVGLAARHPNVTEQLAQMIDDGRAAAVSGPMHELPELLMGLDSALSELRRGDETLQRILSTGPSIFGRRRWGLHAHLPQLLQGLEFRGAVHASFDESVVPSSANEMIEWESPSHHSIAALAIAPADAASGETFLTLGINLARQFESAHQATAFLAHWPAHYHESWDDLNGVTRRATLLGDWATIDEVIDTTFHPGYGDSFHADEYRPAVLEADCAAHAQRPISRWIDYWRRNAELLALQTLEAMCHAARGGTMPDATLPDRELRRRIDLATQSEVDEGLDRQLINRRNRLISEFAQAVGCRQEPNQNPAAWLICNPTASQNWTTARPVTQSASSDPRDSDVPVSREPILRVAAEVPAWGYQVVAAADDARKRPASAKGTKSNMLWSAGLQNDRFELEIDPRHGGILAVRRHGRRGNILSQRLAWRLYGAGSHPSLPPEYAEITDVHWKTEQLAATVAHATAQGAFCHEGRALGKFQQSFRIEKDSPLIRVEVTLDLDHELTESPWREYVGSRLAWSDPTARRYCDSLESRQQVRLERLIAPNYVEIESENECVTLFPQGLAYHRQSAANILDTLLVVGRESRRQFQFALAVDQSGCVRTAQSLLVDGWALPIQRPASQLQRAWLFHVQPRHLAPFRIETHTDESGVCTGVAVWLRETEGRDGMLQLTAPRSLTAARLLNLAGQVRQSLDVEGDTVAAPFHAFDILAVHLEW